VDAGGLARVNENKGAPLGAPFSLREVSVSRKPETNSGPALSLTSKTPAKPDGAGATSATKLPAVFDVPEPSAWELDHPTRRRLVRSHIPCQALAPPQFPATHSIRSQ